MKDHKIINKIKDDASISQLKGRRIHIQMQKTVDAKMKNITKTWSN